MKYKLVIFDLDGTLLDTLDDLTDSLNFALEKFGLPLRKKEEVRSFVGDGIRKLVERGVPANLPDDDIENVYKNFSEYYGRNCAVKTVPYDGISETIARLRKAGCITAVLSNKEDRAVGELCSRYFGAAFDFTAGERKGILKKPSPEPVFYIMEKFGVSSCETAYIGDSDVDIQTAKNAGVDCISVAWGFKDAEFLSFAGAKIIAASAKDVADIILNS